MSKHQIIDQIQKKQEPVLHVLDIMLSMEMSKLPIIDQRLKRKPDLRLREILVHYHQYRHSLQENHQVVVKITQNQITNLKVIQEDQQTHNQKTHNQKQIQKQILNNLIGM